MAGTQRDPFEDPRSAQDELRQSPMLARALGLQANSEAPRPVDGGRGGAIPLRPAGPRGGSGQEGDKE
jgi:hypothetical protein